MEIPLLRESKSFADRLYQAATEFGESRYYLHRRINWSYRYCRDFYEQEAVLFRQDADSYIANSTSTKPVVSDVFAVPLGVSQILSIVVKVLAHWVFAAAAYFFFRDRKTQGNIYRKCYVDDIELVFDPDEKGVLRAVYPFPISPMRQLRYLRYLQKAGYRFRLDGNRYSWRDLALLVVRRDVRAMARLEVRAELRRAHILLQEKFDLVQLSDEFNIGSLDFSRSLSRGKLPVTNASHGVGKYFPLHKYRHFNILTDRQREYYRSEGECEYRRFSLNTQFGLKTHKDRATLGDRRFDVQLVFLSQHFGEQDSLIAIAEKQLIAELSAEFGQSDAVGLYYKPHPNRTETPQWQGWTVIRDIDTINALDNAVLASFFSTCQIDRRFKGKKYLVRSGLLRPEIAFDDTHIILDSGLLINLLRAS